MVYRNMEELLRGFYQAFDKCSGEPDHPSLEPFKRLAKVYLDASANPPDGVIGVGIITYAERKLVEAQE